MIDLPKELSSLRQFCCRDGKQPITKKPNGNLTVKWTDPITWMTLEEAFSAIGKVYRKENPAKPGEWLEIPVNGIGFINSKSDDQTKQIIGGDIDACRDPMTGELSPFAAKFLQDTQPFYQEVSPSLCGIRMFYLGHLPNRVDSLFANGPDDLNEDSKARILTAKPLLKKKIDEGKGGWNGIELYETGRHLTITGISPKRSDAIDRSTEIMIALAPIVANPPPKGETCGWAKEMDKDAMGEKLPKISILDVIETEGWKESGGQLLGPHPTLGSTTGQNVVVNPDENTYCWMHNGINAGGDAWVWLAHECGAVPWEAKGEGLLRDQAVKVRTITHAIERGLIKKEDVPEHVPVKAVLALKDVAFEIGEGDKAYWKFSPTLATKSILKTIKLAKAKGGDSRDPIYYFDGQIFIPDGERIIHNMLCKAAGDLATLKNKKETVSRLHDLLLSYAVVFDYDPYLLGVQNGVVDLRTGQFRGYRPEDLVTDQIQVEYDQTALCPLFIQFIKDVAPNEIDQCTLVDWFAIHAIRSMFPYVMFLNGLGRNGKGIYERVLKRFYGEGSFCSMALEELTPKNNRFAGADLINKRGQIVAEAGEDHSKGKRTIPTSFIKNATGDGIIDSDRKNKTRVRFKPFHKTTIDSNDMPRIDDMSKGWIERFCKVDMPFNYVDEPRQDHFMERKKDPDMFSKLTTDAELSGILNLVIERTVIISKTMKITKRPGEDMFMEYKKQSNSVNTFIELFCEYEEMGDSKKDIPLDIVYEAYVKWCEIVVCDKIDDKRFGATIKKMCGNREAGRIRDESNTKKRIYRGLRFDINRYQAHINHCLNIIRPITAPLLPH